MLKNLTLTLAVVALSTGCVIVDGSTASDTNSATESGTDTDATATDSQGTGTDSQGTDSDSEGTGTDSDSEGTGTDTEGTTTDDTDTEGTTTDDETTTTDSDTDSDTEGESDTEGALPCGWDPRENYYACEDVGGVPGAEDPLMMVPYSCPGDLMAGAECGEVDNLGCCDEKGHNWYCIDDALIVEECS